MDKFIQNIQNKPERARRQILLGSSIGITAIIALFWVVSVINTGANTTTDTRTVETSPFSLLKDNVSNAYQGFSQSVQETIASSTVSTQDQSIDTTVDNEATTSTQY